MNVKTKSAKPAWPKWAPPFIAAITEDDYPSSKWPSRLMWQVKPRFKKRTAQWNHPLGEKEYAVCMFIPPNFMPRFPKGLPPQKRIIFRPK